MESLTEHKTATGIVGEKELVKWKSIEVNDGRKAIKKTTSLRRMKPSWKATFHNIFHKVVQPERFLNDGVAEQ